MNTHANANLRVTTYRWPPSLCKGVSFFGMAGQATSVQYVENFKKWRIWHAPTNFLPLANFQIIVKNRIVLSTSEAWLRYWQIWQSRRYILSFVEERDEEEKLWENHIMGWLLCWHHWSSITVPRQSCSHTPPHTQPHRYIFICTPKVSHAHPQLYPHPQSRTNYTQEPHPQWHPCIISPYRFTHSHPVAATDTVT